MSIDTARKTAFQCFDLLVVVVFFVPLCLILTVSNHGPGRPETSALDDYRAPSGPTY